MNFMKKHKGKFIAVICISVLLIISYFYNENTVNQPVYSQKTEKAEKCEEKTVVEQAVVTENTLKEDCAETEEKTAFENDAYDKIQNPDPSDNTLTCTMKISCETALGKTSDKITLIPENGILYPEQNVVFYEGESVFNVLVREMKKQKIHLEFVNIPIYNSSYIEGIGNLYEFDCGELSGWMYKVNDYFPNYGSSQYILQPDDRVEWVYTCDLGKDVGGEYSARNGKPNE